MRKKSKKNSYIGDMMELTALNVAGTTGVIAMNSLPSTPSVPAVDVAKGFAGQSFGLMATMKGAGMLMKSVKDLEKVGKKFET